MKKYLIIMVLCLFILGCGDKSGMISGGNEETADKWCNGVDVTFFAGGTEDDAYSTIISNGAARAAEDMGADIEFVYSGWVADQMALDFKEAIERSPDVIVGMGHPGLDVMGPLIDEAYRKGIIVTMTDTDLPAIRKEYASRGFGFVGPEPYSYCNELTKATLRKFKFQTGDEALLLLAEAIPASGVGEGRSMFGVGCVDGLSEGGLIIHQEVIPDAVNMKADSPEGVDFIGEMLEKYPDIKLIVVDHGSLTEALGSILRELGKDADDYVVVGYDIYPVTAQEIKSGYIDMVEDMQIFMAGYLPVVQACLSEKYGFAGMYIDSGKAQIDASNIDKMMDLIEKHIR